MIFSRAIYHALLVMCLAACIHSHTTLNTQSTYHHHNHHESEIHRDHALHSDDNESCGAEDCEHVSPYVYRTMYTACPLCGSTSSAGYVHATCPNAGEYPMLEDVNMSWMKCNQCGHVYTNGYYTPEALGKIFFSESFEIQNIAKMSGELVKVSRDVSGHIIHLVSQLRGESINRANYEGRWLDVGFGNGILVAVAEEYGYAAAGIDTRPEAVEALRQFGYSAFLMDFDIMTPELMNGGVDVISMADVLEHMPFPKQSLLRAHSLLNEMGLIFISMPNIESVLWKHLNHVSANPYWCQLEHFHNFSRDRLFKLLRETGFKPIHYGISERYISCMEIVAEKVELE